MPELKSSSDFTSSSFSQRWRSADSMFLSLVLSADVQECSASVSFDRTSSQVGHASVLWEQVDVCFQRSTCIICSLQPSLAQSMRL